MRMPCAMQGIAIPTHTMFTEDYIREAAEDNVLQTSTADGTFADLGISPQRIDVGLPIEHVRHYRVGGYDVGACSFPSAPCLQCRACCWSSPVAHTMACLQHNLYAAQM
jgi:hypothetical protein